MTMPFGVFAPVSWMIFLYVRRLMHFCRLAYSTKEADFLSYDGERKSASFVGRGFLFLRMTAHFVLYTLAPG